MKKTIKVLTICIAIFFTAILVVFAINTTDEQRSETTQQFLREFPEQKGFPLNEFKSAGKIKGPRFDLKLYSDYQKASAEFDNILENNKILLDKTLMAFAIGKIAVKPHEDVFVSGTLHVFPSENHKLFLVFLSQKIYRGQKAEALKLLEQSNLFFKNMIETPHTFISKNMAVALLKRNAKFTKDLVDNSIIKNPPSNLKNSFIFNLSPEQMWFESSLKEMQATSDLFLKSKDGHFFSEFGFKWSENQKLMRILASFQNQLLMKLLRPNQTLNWMSSVYAQQSSPECFIEESNACDPPIKPYKSTTLGMLLNPTGRSFAAIFSPEFNGSQQKRFKKSIIEIQSIASAI